MKEEAQNCYCFGNPYEAAAAIAALAISIAKGKTQEEISLLGTYFVQLGDTLETIAETKEHCSEK